MIFERKPNKKSLAAALFVFFAAAAGAGIIAVGASIFCRGGRSVGGGKSSRRGL